jgi:hypothetical protein
MRLHHILFAGLVAIPSVSGIHAQNAVSTPRRFGIAAGINSSTFSGSDTEDASRRTGFIGGIFLVAPLAPGFAIQPELLYSMKGAKFDDPTEGVTGTFKMDYVEVPLLVRFDLVSSGGVKPFLYAGPAISFKAGCKVDAEGQGQSVSLDCDEFGSDTKFKTVDYGAVIGGGLAFDMAGKMFTIGARYNHGLGKIAEDSETKHRVISVLATLEFPWGK